MRVGVDDEAVLLEKYLQSEISFLRQRTLRIKAILPKPLTRWSKRFVCLLRILAI